MTDRFQRLMQASNRLFDAHDEISHIKFMLAPEDAPEAIATLDAIVAAMHVAMDQLEGPIEASK